MVLGMGMVVGPVLEERQIESLEVELRLQHALECDRPVIWALFDIIMGGVMPHQYRADRGYPREDSLDMN